MAYQPKSYKKFVATAATATLVATAVVPAAFADDVKTAAFTDVAPQYQAAVDFVVEQAIAKGISETQFGISKEIIRGDAAIMIANAAGLNNPDAPASGFTDVPTRGALAINSLKAAGVTNGKTATSFDFSGDITRGEAAVFLANAFDLKGDTSNVKFTDVNSRYMAAVAALVDNKVTNGKSATQFGTDDNITRGDFARWLLALEDLIVDPAEPGVTGVTSVNVVDTNIIEVSFGTPVDEETATDASNYLLDGASLPASAELELSADGKKVTITMSADDALENGSTVTLTTSVDDSIEDINEKVVAETTTTLKVNDTKLPTVTGSKYVFADDELTVSFSEPLEDEGTVVVTDSDGVDQELVAELDESGLFLTLDTSSLEDDEVYTLTMVGATDLAGNRFAANTVTANFRTGATELVAPTVKSVKALASDVIEVTFSEELSETGTLNGTDLEEYEYEVDATGTVYTIELFEEMEDDSVVSFTFAGQEDLNANKLVTVTKKISYFDDVTAPKLVTTEVEGRIVTLTFDENVYLSDVEDAVLRTPENVVIEIDNAEFDYVDGNMKQITVDLSDAVGADAVSGSYKLTVAEDTVFDTEGNSTSYTTSFGLSDLPANEVKPEVEDVDYSAADGTVTVYYSEAMNSSALNLSNYKVDGQSVFADAYFSGNKETVVLTLKENVFAFDADRVLSISNVSDLTGNNIDAITEVIEFGDNTAPMLLTAELEEDLETITLTFNENMDAESIVDLSTDFEVLVGGVAQTGTIEEGSGREFTITLEDELTATEYAKTITLTPAEDFDVADEAGNLHPTFKSVTVAK
ncbi:Ig-like domain-containing protein [Planococcus chinensis]|uniref:Ig-like domain-containing protein n=1 Tax=Planococcus chinensis TaxID=272917 RepID=A0ABW4QED9_9BACL